MGASHLESQHKSNSSVKEYNFDGLIGPTHNYAGLPVGNKASMKHKNQRANPQEAALEGLEKMKFLMDKGFKQALFPPQERPDLNFLKQLGLTGNEEQIIYKAWKISPSLLAACYSASSVWAANSAVVSPSADTKDKKVHFTPANLQSYLHRSLETKQSRLILKKIFPNPHHFVHHPPLPSLPALSDEGAANHNRLCEDYSSKGVELFVYGRNGFSSHSGTKIFHSRQTEEASKIIALHHKLNPKKTIFAAQNPRAIDAGAFHNDVVCLTDQNLILCHELAFLNTKKVLNEIEKKMSPTPLLKILVRNRDISLDEAVSSYMFNSQLLPLRKGKWMLLAPSECEDTPAVKEYLKSLSQNSPIQEIHFIPIRQSMQNGGGPACLRLRIALTKKEADTIHKKVILNKDLYKQLKAWIKKHYRYQMDPKDLLDPLLIKESQAALDDLSQILQLKSIYSFQHL